MPAKRPTHSAHAKGLATSWKLLPATNTGRVPIALCRPGFACSTEEEPEVRNWANRFPADFTDAWIAFVEANKED
jgi:hypothetical protein